LHTLEITQGAGEKRPRRIQHHRAGNQQTDPAKEGLHAGFHPLVIASIQGYRQHHDLHCSQSGYCQAPQGLVFFLLVELFLPPGIKWMGDITNGGNCPQNFAQMDQGIVPLHLGTMRRVIHPELYDTRQGIHMPFIEPDTGGTDNSFQDQRSLFHLGSIPGFFGNFAVLPAPGSGP